MLNNVLWSQQTLYHLGRKLNLEKPLTSYGIKDTIRAFDSINKLNFYAVLLFDPSAYKFMTITSSDIQLYKIYKLHYSNSNESYTFDVDARLKDSTLYWDGKFVSNNKSSQVKVERLYQMNKMVGISTYYHRGKVQSITSVINGTTTVIGIDAYEGRLSYYHKSDSLNKRFGVFISFQENDEIEAFFYYKNGLIEGKCYNFHDDGSIEKIEFYKKGVLLRTKKYKKGKKSLF